MTQHGDTIGRSVKMDAKALIEGWDMPPEARRAAIHRMVKTVADKDSKPREAIAATKALLAIDRLRVAAAATVDGHVASSTTDPEEARRAMREDPAYLEYLRSKALAEDDA